jgi:hypothetical protein
MRRSLVVLGLASLAAACELDFTGIGDGFAQAFCESGWCAPGPPHVWVLGTVRVGTYVAQPEEAFVLLYDASDTLTARDSIPLWWSGNYLADLGESPAAAACGYLARAVFWSGERTALRRLLPSADSCKPAVTAWTGPDFGFPAYDPLETPFVISGMVWVGESPATAGDAVASLQVRTEGGQQATVHVSTDDEGIFSYETTEGALRFAFCHSVLAGVARVVPDSTASVELGPVPDGRCDDGRRLPDARLRWRKAASGRVYLGDASGGLPAAVAAGAAHVALLSPRDSTVVGEESETYDDGSYHVWFPYEMKSPGCDWLLRAELAETGEVQIRPLLPEGTTGCYPPVYDDFAFGP